MEARASPNSEALPQTVGALGESATARSSNTVCVFDPHGDLRLLPSTALDEFAGYGDLARVDISLVEALGCAFLTYYDVRSAEQVLQRLAGRVEPFPPLAHDCRIVCVKVGALFEKFPVLAATGGFGRFGEVAHVSMSGGDALVEYFDLRAASRLLVVAGSAASPALPAQGRQQSLQAISASFPSRSPEAPLAGSSAPAAVGLSGGQPGPLPPARAPPPAEGAAVAAATGAIGNSGRAGGADSAATKEASERPLRVTKVASKDFARYDIDPDRILRGEDPRTTCMVRNLKSSHARRDFLAFLERCGLHERYTFFYMPSKSHRIVPTGLAFVNFVAPRDVHRLFVMVQAGLWSKFVAEPGSKPPAVSYANLQGHEKLSQHFCSSAVVHEPDPEKRPIFRHEVLRAARRQAHEDEGGADAAGSSDAGAHLSSHTAGSRAAFRPDGEWCGALLMKV